MRNYAFENTSQCGHQRASCCILSQTPKHSSQKRPAVIYGYRCTDNGLCISNMVFIDHHQRPDWTRTCTKSRGTCDHWSIQDQEAKAHETIPFSSPKGCTFASYFLRNCWISTLPITNTLATIMGTMCPDNTQRCRYRDLQGQSFNGLIGRIFHGKSRRPYC